MLGDSGQSLMKSHLRFGLIGLICSMFLFAQSYPPLTEHGQQLLASDVNAPGSGKSVSRRAGDVDILSDTQGVDLGPYLRSALNLVKENWYKVIPPSAKGPRMKRGDVSIELAILKNGKIKGMKLVGSSGEVSLDHAAWLGISDSRLAPLPSEYSGHYLALRLHFSYSPENPSDRVLQYWD
jgi:outer membrane biosynthesis protein TonB